MQGCRMAVLVMMALGLASANTLGKQLPYGDGGDGGDDDGDTGLLLPVSGHHVRRASLGREDADARLKVAEFVREVKRVLSGVRRRTSHSFQLEKRQVQQRVGKISKRHCWDVADVCCMWNIC